MTLKKQVGLDCKSIKKKLCIGYDGPESWKISKQLTRVYTIGAQLNIINAMTIWILKTAGGVSDIGIHFSNPKIAACKWSAILFRNAFGAVSYNLPHVPKNILSGSLASRISFSVTGHSVWNSGNFITIRDNCRMSSLAFVDNIEHLIHSRIITIWSILLNLFVDRIDTKNFMVVLKIESTCQIVFSVVLRYAKQKI